MTADALQSPIIVITGPLFHSFLFLTVWAEKFTLVACCRSFWSTLAGPFVCLKQKSRLGLCWLIIDLPWVRVVWRQWKLSGYGAHAPLSRALAPEQYLLFATTTDEGSGWNCAGMNQKREREGVRGHLCLEIDPFHLLSVTFTWNWFTIFIVSWMAQLLKKVQVTWS